jgi:hypothetical protein
MFAEGHHTGRVTVGNPEDPRRIRDEEDAVAVLVLMMAVDRVVAAGGRPSPFGADLSSFTTAELGVARDHLTREFTCPCGSRTVDGAWLLQRWRSAWTGKARKVNV